MVSNIYQALMMMGGIGMRAEGPCAQAIRARGEKSEKENYEDASLFRRLHSGPY
jgi:hypothetical protein